MILIMFFSIQKTHKLLSFSVGATCFFATSCHTFLNYMYVSNQYLVFKKVVNENHYINFIVKLSKDACTYVHVCAMTNVYTFNILYLYILSFLQIFSKKPSDCFVCSFQNSFQRICFTS